jgi:hypothetical protein
MKYWENKDWKDERGAVIIERTLYDTEKLEVVTKYFGKGMVMLNTPMGEIPHEFEVEFDVESIQEAFIKFEDQMNEKAPEIAETEAKNVIEEIKSRMQQQQTSIITPDQMQPAARPPQGFNPNIRG